MTFILSHPLVRLIAGFVVWSVAFIVLYAAQALGCAYDWGDWHRPILWLLYLLALAPLVCLALPGNSHDHQGTLYTAALWANRAALLAAILVFLPVSFVSLCI